MSSPKYASPLVLKPKTSFVFISIFSIAYLGAMFSILSLPWHWGLKFVALVILAASLVYPLTKRGIRSFRSLTWKEGSEWYIELNDGRHYVTHLLPTSFVSPWLVILNLAASEEYSRLSIVFFRDALDQDSFRRLRVRLQLERQGEDAEHG